MKKYGCLSCHLAASVADELGGKIQTLHCGTTDQHLLKWIGIPILVLSAFIKCLKGKKTDSKVDSLQSNSSLLDNLYSRSSDLW